MKIGMYVWTQDGLHVVCHVSRTGFTTRPATLFEKLKLKLFGK